jgi:hypothetical protein
LVASQGYRYQEAGLRYGSRFPFSPCTCAPVNLGLPHHHLLRVEHYPKVAGHGQLTTAAEGEAVYSSDYGLGILLDVAEHLLPS